MLAVRRVMTPRQIPVIRSTGAAQNSPTMDDADGLTGTRPTVAGAVLAARPDPARPLRQELRIA